MIRSEAEYQVALKRLDEHRDYAMKQRAELEAEGYMPEQVERGMEALVTFQVGIAEDIHIYEQLKRGNIEPIKNLQGLGRLLIALRIYRNWSQADLAKKLGVSEASVSRDEKNEYHGITLDRAQKIINAFRAKITVSIEDIPQEESELISC